MTGFARYEDDIVAGAEQQAALLREGQFAQLDIAHLAEEIEDVCKSEQRELAARMALLIGHLLEWERQPGRRGASREITIRNQRRSIERRLEETPSLRPRLNDPAWWAGVWDDATAQAASETGLADFPEACPWSADEVLDQDWKPGD
jgi:hypothetical protein